VIEPATPRREERSSGISSKAKSIAEKLGFINFDEEEIETPAYLRSESRDRDLGV